MKKNRKTEKPAAPQNPRIVIHAMFDPVWIVGDRGTEVRSLLADGGASVGVVNLTFLGRTAKVPVRSNDRPRMRRPPFVMKSAPWYERLFVGVDWESVRSCADEVYAAVRKMHDRMSGSP